MRQNTRQVARLTQKPIMFYLGNRSIRNHTKAAFLITQANKHRPNFSFFLLKTVSKIVDIFFAEFSNQIP
jgi:hypothetical protein